MELTNVEELAIEKLEEVAKIWPETLWLYSASGRLSVVKKKNNQRAIIVENENIQYDSQLIVRTINIENDGGDW